MTDLAAIRARWTLKPESVRCTNDPWTLCHMVIAGIEDVTTLSVEIDRLRLMLEQTEMALQAMTVESGWLDDDDAVGGPAPQESAQ